MGFIELTCPRCGGKLQPNEKYYNCACCGKVFEKTYTLSVADELKKVLNEHKQEIVSNLRRQLWTEMNAQYVNSKKIVELARGIKKYLPEDYFANFCEIANVGNVQQVNDFLNNTTKAQMDDYADIVISFMLISAQVANLTSISLFIERAYKCDTVNYDRYVTAYERVAEQVKNGIYELNITRDVFLAYSSADINKVIDLCDYLEKQNISCFLALRNLRHGRGAVDNYDKALQTAMNNCKTVVFVSSKNSRNLSCDALTKELPYIKQKDLNHAPIEYANAYDKLPQEYMMPRVEYLIEGYRGDVGEHITKEFFHGLEWCKNKEAVAKRIIKYLTENRGETARLKAERERRFTDERFAELEKKISSATTFNAPASASAQSLLTRASQELQVDNQNKAKEYYGRVLDIKPDCAEAWYGLFLIDFVCTSDEELLAKINKSRYVDTLLFNIRCNRNFMQAKKFADDKLLSRIIAIEQATNNRIYILVSNIPIEKIAAETVHKFCKGVLTEQPDNYEAQYLLFLAKLGYTNEDSLINNLTNTESADDLAKTFDAIENTQIFSSNNHIMAERKRKISTIIKGRAKILYKENKTKQRDELKISASLKKKIKVCSYQSEPDSPADIAKLVIFGSGGLCAIAMVILTIIYAINPQIFFVNVLFTHLNNFFSGLLNIIGGIGLLVIAFFSVIGGLIGIILGIVLLFILFIIYLFRLILYNIDEARCNENKEIEKVLNDYKKRITIYTDNINKLEPLIK